MRLTRQAIALAPDYGEALEHLGTVLVTRSRRYDEGIGLLERAVAAHDQDPGLWYALGWCCEFAAHGVARRGMTSERDARSLYERAAEAFRRCLDLRPEDKLADDAADLLEHVENELSD